MLRQAQALSARAIREGRVELRPGDTARALPYEDASSDKLYAVQVLYFLPDPLPILREVRRR
jgi:SAM-dependent methyltransferase